MMRTKRRFEPVVPTSVIGALIYIGVMAILLRDVHLWLSTTFWSRNLWNDFTWLWWAFEEESRMRWSFAAVGCFLVLYLWAQGRDFVARRVWPQALSCVLAAILVLALQWTILASFDAVTATEYELVRVHP